MWCIKTKGWFTVYHELWERKKMLLFWRCFSVSSTVFQVSSQRLEFEYVHRANISTFLAVSVYHRNIMVSVLWAWHVGLSFSWVVHSGWDSNPDRRRCPAGKTTLLYWSWPDHRRLWSTTKNLNHPNQCAGCKTNSHKQQQQINSICHKTTGGLRRVAAVGACDWGCRQRKRTER